jgi:hypothetical protein
MMGKMSLEGSFYYLPPLIIMFCVLIFSLKNRLNLISAERSKFAAKHLKFAALQVGTPSVPQ